MSATVADTQDAKEAKEAKARKQEATNERAVEKIFRMRFPQASYVRATSVSQTQFRVNVFEKYQTGFGIVRENRIIHSEFYKYELATPSKVSGEPVKID
jgi:Ni/Co efflux regulator RcnB